MNQAIKRSVSQQQTIAADNAHASRELPSGLYGVRPDRVWVRPRGEQVRPELRNIELVDAIEWMHVRRGRRFDARDLDTLAELGVRAWSYAEANALRTWTLPTWADPLVPRRRQGWIRFLALLITAYRAGAVGVWLGYHEAIALVGGVSTSTWCRWIREMEAAGLIRATQTWLPDESGERPRRFGRLLYRIGPALEEAAGPGLCEGAAAGSREVNAKWAARAAAGARAKARKARNELRSDTWELLHPGEQTPYELEDSPEALSANVEPEPEPEPEHERSPHPEPHRPASHRTPAGGGVLIPSPVEGGGGVRTGAICVHKASLIGSRFCQTTPPPPSSGEGIKTPPPAGSVVRATREKKGRPTAATRPPSATSTRTCSTAAKPRSEHCTSNSPKGDGADPTESCPVSHTLPPERESAIVDLLARLQKRGLPCQRGAVRDDSQLASTRDGERRSSEPAAASQDRQSQGNASAAGSFAPARAPVLRDVSLNAAAPLKLEELKPPGRTSPAPAVSCTCSQCDGVGYVGDWTCFACGGRGTVRKRVHPDCTHCDGRGTIQIGVDCPDCQGSGKHGI